MNQSKDIFPSKHFLFSKTSSRRLQDVFSVTLFVFKTSWRRLQDIFKTYLQYVFLKRLQDVFKTPSKRLPRRLPDVFARSLAIMSSRRLERQKMLHWRRLQYVFAKTIVSWVRTLSNIYDGVFLRKQLTIVSR